MIQMNFKSRIITIKPVISYFSNLLISARVGMNLTSLLTLIAMFDSVRSEVPKVSYISFMDIWMTVCVIIIFLAIAEYAVSHSLTRFKKKKKAICLDKISRVIMMGLFILFNIIYWPLLTRQLKCILCKIDHQDHGNSTLKLKVFWINNPQQ